MKRKLLNRFIIPLLKLFAIVMLCIFAYLILFKTKKENLSQNEKNDQLVKIENHLEKIEQLSNKILPTDDSAIQSENLIKCFNTIPKTQYEQRGKYWILANYVKAEEKFNCDESITYTTHGDFTFLDNLIPLLQRWRGPVSLSLYSPGTDFVETIKRILYLGQCHPIVRNFVTFHIIFENEHLPNLNVTQTLSKEKIDCYQVPAFGDSVQTYKKLNELFYPINILRNVARQMATTHFVLASDIELYPSSNLIQDFLQMVKNEIYEDKNILKVYVLPVFEIEADVKALPESKKELVDMLIDKVAIPFHKNVCPTCHKIPNYKKWVSLIENEDLNVYEIVKREGEFQHWEPFYIGTNSEPLWDERLTWEGQSNKMTQAYLLCVLDYELHVLDNGFLVHRPGIKMKRDLAPVSDIVRHQNTIIQKTIFPELKLLYGEKSECHMIPIYKNTSMSK